MTGVQTCALPILFGIVLIIVDIVLVVVDFSLAKSAHVGDILEAVSLAISFFFLFDVLLRIYVEG